MHLSVRLLSTMLAVATITTTATGARAADAPAHPRQVPYQRNDPGYYLKSDVLRVDPTALILPDSAYQKNGDLYLVPGKLKTPKVVYVIVSRDWIEPITPPGATSLNIAPDAMQIREPQGDVEVALPSAPANFISTTDGMSIPNGTVVKTGDNSTAAVLFGGVDSARLTPNSAAAVQQTVLPTSRSTEVDLTSGAVFSKVGTQAGVTQEYMVHTPNGVAAAHGTDFVTLALPNRTDVWVAQGTVQLLNLDGKVVGEASSDGYGLKIIRHPVMVGARAIMLADSETVSTVLDFIPLANIKINALRQKTANGIPLSDDEKAYLARLPSVSALIKLSALAPPKPAPKPTVVATPAVPAAAAAPAPASAPVSAAAPIEIGINANGTVELDGMLMTIGDLKARLTSIGTQTPGEPVILMPDPKATHDQIHVVRALCHQAKLRIVRSTQRPPSPPPPPSDKNPGAASEPPLPSTPSASTSAKIPPTPSSNLPTPDLLMSPSMSSAASNAPPVAPGAPTSDTNTPASAPNAPPAPSP